MAKLTLNDVTTGYQSTTAANANNALIEAAMENTVSRDGTTPNTFTGNMDMNGNSILNLGNPITIEGWVWEGPWVTATAYTVGDVIETGGSAYICIVAHTSGTFATDLTAVKWQLVASASLPSQSGNSGQYLTTDGSVSSWNDISTTWLPLTGGAITGDNTHTGDIIMSGQSVNEAVHSEAAHATTSDIWEGGNTCLLTGGVVTFTDVADAPQAGAVRYVVANDAHIITDNAALEVDGNANYTCASGDLLRFEAKTTSTFRVSVLSHGDSAGTDTNYVKQMVHTSDGELATGTTAIPHDDTIPQNTEGDEYMTLAITPTDTSSRLKIEVVVAGTINGDVRVTTALFQDSTANALAATQILQSANWANTMSFNYVMTAGTTSATTFKVRIGGTSGTYTFNGGGAARKLGGVLSSSITITEMSA